ncbi:hypothetical protein ENBRE01_1619 [Enteropsectra breve]|nr:hypothetical protein ENBRE01_1619 [Enteropsectra breve]
MIEISEDDLEILINEYRNAKLDKRNTGGKQTAFTLKELVNKGLMYAYGELHYLNGEVCKCTSPFNIYSEHSCSLSSGASGGAHGIYSSSIYSSNTKYSNTHGGANIMDVHGVSKRAYSRKNSHDIEAPKKGKEKYLSSEGSKRKNRKNNIEIANYDDYVNKRSNNIEIKGIHKLFRTQHPAFASWTGSNLAVVGNETQLHGYFKNDLLFSKSFRGCTALAASANMIYLGNAEGEVIHFDPRLQALTALSLHKARVNGIKLIDGEPLSFSEDGTIFYQGLESNLEGAATEINTSGVIFAEKYGSAFVCACRDNSIAVYEDGDITLFRGHTTAIRSLCVADGICISSSADGVFGLYRSNSSFYMQDVSCSHARSSESSSLVLGFGLSSVKLLDLNRMDSVFKYREKATAADFYENMVVYGSNRNLCFRDIRCNEPLDIFTGNEILYVKFSGNGDMIYVGTEESPLLVDLRYLR